MQDSILDRPVTSGSLPGRPGTGSVGNASSHRDARPGLRVVMLVTDAFGGFGGIAKFNRDLIRALGASPSVASVDVFPRVISDPPADGVPPSVGYDLAASRGKVAYARRVGGLSISTRRVDVLICGHIHLLPIAWPIARMNRARLVLVVHGIEGVAAFIASGCR